MTTQLRALFVGVSVDDLIPIVAELQRDGYELSYLRVDTPEATKVALAKDEWDVLLADHSMLFSGISEASKQVQHEAADSSLIVVLGQEEAEVLIAATNAQASNYVNKNNPTLLNAAIARELRKAETRRERRRTEESLKESRELFRTVVEQADESIFLVDIETQCILETNAAFHRALGYTAEELAGMTLYDVVVHDRESVDSYARQALDKGHYFVGEQQYRRKDGSLMNVEVSASHVSHNGKNAICVIAHDVTEQKKTEQELQQSLEALLAIYEAGHILGSTLEAEEIGSRLLQLMRRISSSATAVISVPADHRELRVWQAIGFENLWRRARYTPEVQSTLRTVMESGEHTSLRLDPPDLLAEPLVALFLPLKIRNRIIGVLEVYGSDAITEKAVMDILVNLTTKAASALENARLYGALAERERQLQELVGKLVVTQEEERRRVAYEVHDGPTQLAVAAYQHLQAFAKNHPPVTHEGKRALGEVVELARRTVGESRQIIANLRPTVLDDFGLATAIRLHVEGLRSKGWQIRFEETLGDVRVPDPVETALFRVVQEALTNIGKHAGTSRARVRLAKTRRGIRLLVRDYGVGLRTRPASGGGPGERVGLAGMRERIGLVGGDLRVYSREGIGTLIRADVPFVSETRAKAYASAGHENPTQISSMEPSED